MTHNKDNKECEMGRPDWDRWGSKPCSCPDDSTQIPWENIHKMDSTDSAPDRIIFDGIYLTIGDAPSFMLSKKNAERLREFVNLVEEAQMGGAAGTGGGIPLPHYPHKVKDPSPE
jgi:hypothetical protein